MMKLALLFALFACATATVYFKEDFSGDWESNWVTSEHDDYGKFVATAGKFGSDVGIQTSQDAKFYSISAAFDKFSNEGRTSWSSTAPSSSRGSTAAAATSRSR